MFALVALSASLFAQAAPSIGESRAGRLQRLEATCSAYAPTPADTTCAMILIDEDLLTLVSGRGRSMLSEMMFDRKIKTPTRLTEVARFAKIAALERPQVATQCEVDWTDPPCWTLIIRRALNDYVDGKPSLVDERIEALAREIGVPAKVPAPAPKR